MQYEIKTNNVGLGFLWAHVPLGATSGMHGQQVQGHKSSDKEPICMCLSAFSSCKVLLVNTPVICKQTAFTSGYE